MTPEQVFLRLTHLLEQESAAPIRRFWLSFADPDLPRGSQFLGVVIVRARGIVGALDEVRRLGVNPGGEVQGFELPDEAPIAEADLNRLLSADEARALGGG